MSRRSTRPGAPTRGAAPAAARTARGEAAAPTPAFLRRFFERDRYAARAGIRLVEVGPGQARARMRITPEHLNGVDVAQGGAIFTLADLAFAAACNSRGPVALAINVSISFLRAVERGTLTAEAREVSRSSRLSTVEVEVRGRGGELVALFHGTAYVTGRALAEVAARRGRTTGGKGRRR